MQRRFCIDSFHGIECGPAGLRLPPGLVQIRALTRVADQGSPDQGSADQGSVPSASYFLPFLKGESMANFLAGRSGLVFRPGLNRGGKLGRRPFVRLFILFGS